MGINGLLPLLKSIHKPCNLKKFEGKTLAVDAYGWLHRGTVSCAMDLAMGRPTRKFVDFAMHRVRMLQHFGVTPYLVFDGDYLPSKAATEADRSKRREESKKAALELQNAGKISQAYLEFQKAVDVTPEMARQLIDELKKTGVQYVVAPYEADAQMVYLERKGIIHGILSEDSDLLVFGAKCLLTKLDQYGNCIEINKADFCAVKEVNLTGWSDTEFRCMAILSGCDYLPSINNMGLKTAYRMVRKHKTIDKVVRMLQFDGKFMVPKDYLAKFYQAERTFLYQRVFCPLEQKLVLHTQPEQPIDESKMPFIGAYVPDDVARGVARGDLNPITRVTIVPRTMVRSNSAWATARRQPPQSMSLCEGMKGKPINNYFQPKRVPLAELDVNTFTLSPSQQEVLQRNSGPWSANPLPLSQLASTGRDENQRSPAPRPAIQLPRSYVDSTGGNVNDPSSESRPPQPQVGRHSRAPTISEPRAPKRVRLCEDVDTPASPSQKVEGRSRFFSTETDPTPTARSRRSKKKLEIFSDDSVGGVKLGDAGVVSKDEEDDLSKCNISSAQLQDPVVNEEPASQSTIPSLTSSLSMTSSAEPPPTPTISTPLPTEFKKLGGKFAYAAGGLETPKNTVFMHGIATPMSTVSKPSRIPVPVKASLPSKTPVQKNMHTSLQRLGATATNRMKFPMTPPVTPLLQGTIPTRRSIFNKNSVPFPEVVKPTNKHSAVVKPANMPLTQPEKKDMVLQEQKIGGSEDLIVHDSEEDEPLSPVLANATPSLNFGKFAYSG